MKKILVNKVIALSVIIGLSGCTGYKEIGVHKQSSQTVKNYLMEPPLWIGDSVRYVLKDGKKGTMVISSVSQQSLTGEDGSVIDLDNISSLERKEIAKGKTAAATGAGIGAAAVIAAILISVGLATALISAGG